MIYRVERKTGLAFAPAANIEAGSISEASKKARLREGTTVIVTPMKVTDTLPVKNKLEGVMFNKTITTPLHQETGGEIRDKNNVTQVRLILPDEAGLIIAQLNNAPEMHKLLRETLEQMKCIVYLTPGWLELEGKIKKVLQDIEGK